ncbi:hypothetical protein PMAYCL1PPCAC_05155, partial [Pristionchus mayeri]
GSQTLIYVLEERSMPMLRNMSFRFLIRSYQVRQCLCSEVKSCSMSAAGSVTQCADRCQSHVTAMGASYPAVRQCIQAHQGQIRAAADCVEATFANACANAPGKMAPQRNPYSVQSMAIREITAIIKRSGLIIEAAPLMSAAQRVGGCMGQCAQQNSCAKLGCSLNLPSDAVLVQTSKRCALQAGFTTPTARAICTCLANAGIPRLAALCPKITIS